MNYTEICRAEEFAPYVEAIRGQRAVAVKTADAGGEPRAVWLAWEGARLKVGSQVFSPRGTALLKEALESSPVKVFYDAKKELRLLMGLGIRPSVIFDVMLAGQLLSENGHQLFSPAELARRYLGADAGQEETTDLLRLRRAMIGRLKEEGLIGIAKIEFDCALSVAQMEYYGILLDTAAWRKLTVKAKEEKERALEELRLFTGARPVQTTLWGEAAAEENFDSSAYILSLLREHGLEVKNTSKAALAAHRSHPLVAAVSRYRSAAKLLSSYLLPIPKMLRPDTGRLHPQYAQIAAWTGRMSCYAPNIQQIPRDEAFRSCFAAPEGRRLLIADYPQIELRVAAQITRDRRMLEAYRRGLDLHGLTASLILGKPPESISPQERQYAKAVNFGLIYAMGADGLRLSARQSYGVEMTREQAERFRRLFFEAYPAVRRWHAMLDSRRQPQGRTLAGRKYAFPAWYGLPAHSNAPVQGTAADILKKALGTLALSLSGSDAFPVAAIHDEVIVECPKEHVGYYGAILKNAMEQAAAAILPNVPTAVEVRAARRWSEK